MVVDGPEYSRKFLPKGYPGAGGFPGLTVVHVDTIIRTLASYWGRITSMVVEIAILEAKPGQGAAMREGLARARSVISRAKGYRDSTFQQSIEKPERIVLYIKWDSVDDHVEGFRNGPLFPEWRTHWGEHLAGTPDVLHYEIFAGGQ